jgi:hypothetical protein
MIDRATVHRIFLGVLSVVGIYSWSMRFALGSLLVMAAALLYVGHCEAKAMRDEESRGE